MPDHHLDMVLFDADLGLRIDEFERFCLWLNLDAVLIFHDTSAHHGVVRSGISTLVAAGRLSGVNLPTPRGIFAGKFGVVAIARRGE
jgi:hypothetical protein